MSKDRWTIHLEYQEKQKVYRIMKDGVESKYSPTTDIKTAESIVKVMNERGTK